MAKSCSIRTTSSPHHPSYCNPSLGLFVPPLCVCVSICVSVSLSVQEAPGNLFAIAVLGMLQFAGDVTLRHQIADMNLIPHNFKGTHQQQRDWVWHCLAVPCKEQTFVSWFVLCVRVVCALTPFWPCCTEFVGWMVGSRLFFEFLSWWNTAPGDEAPSSPFTLSDEKELLVRCYCCCWWCCCCCCCWWCCCCSFSMSVCVLFFFVISFPFSLMLTEV